MSDSTARAIGGSSRLLEFEGGPRPGSTTRISPNRNTGAYRRLVTATYKVVYPAQIHSNSGVGGPSLVGRTHPSSRLLEARLLESHVGDYWNFGGAR